MTSGIQLVIFDLGRVLVRICDGWQHACEVAGVAAPDTELSDDAKAALHEVVVRSEIGEIDLAGFCACSSPHLGLPPEHVRALSDVYLLGPYPGAVELIDALNAHGLQTACLSNTNENHWRIMNDPSHASFLPLDRLTHRFASQLLGLRKPDPRIYEHVERATRVEPNRIIFFDDLAENIAAARDRGWHAHQIRIDADPIAQARAYLHERTIL
ncbi:MAG: HAD-IA family hydrolase [Tepidisphaeraceae bacterium]